MLLGSCGGAAELSIPLIAAAAIAAVRVYRSGLPVGLQMVARPRAEADLLAGARVLEDILGLRGTTPIDPRPPKT